MNTRIDAKSKEWYAVYRNLQLEFYDTHSDKDWLGPGLNLKQMERWLATHGMHVIKADRDGRWEWIELSGVDWMEIVLRWG